MDQIFWQGRIVNECPLDWPDYSTDVHASLLSQSTLFADSIRDPYRASSGTRWFDSNEMSFARSYFESHAQLASGAERKNRETQFGHAIGYKIRHTFSSPVGFRRRQWPSLEMSFRQRAVFAAGAWIRCGCSALAWSETRQNLLG